jgi:hypothetical protein
LSERQFGRQLLAHAQPAAGARRDDAVHAQADRAVEFRVGAVGLQDIERIGTGDAGGLVDRGNRAARAGFDGRISAAPVLRKAV